MGEYRPISPVMTQPMVGVILKRWVTVSAFRSLSFPTNEDAWFVGTAVTGTNRNFFLGDHDCSVFSTNGDCGVAGT